MYDTFDYVVGRAVSSLPKFIQVVEKNLRRNGVPYGGSAPAPTRLKRGVLYMRGSATLEELAQLGTQPSMIIPLDRFSRLPPGDPSALERGYSSIFHFTSEDVWRREPALEDQ